MWTRVICAVCIALVAAAALDLNVAAAEISSSQRVLGTGFHRTLDLRLSSEHSIPTIVVRLRFPAAMYVDVDELEHYGFAFRLLNSSPPPNVESPKNEAPPFEIAVVVAPGLSSSSGVTTSHTSISLPIHIRYQSPASSNEDQCKPLFEGEDVSFLIGADICGTSPCLGDDSLSLRKVLPLKHTLHESEAPLVACVGSRGDEGFVLFSTTGALFFGTYLFLKVLFS